jgi:hypothetical protein
VILGPFGPKGCFAHSLMSAPASLEQGAAPVEIVSSNQAPATKVILLKELERTPQPSEFAIPRGESEL